MSGEIIQYDLSLPEARGVVGSLLYKAIEEGVDVAQPASLENPYMAVRQRIMLILAPELKAQKEDYPSLREKTFTVELDEDERQLRLNAANLVSTHPEWVAMESSRRIPSHLKNSKTPKVLGIHAMQLAEQAELVKQKLTV